MDVAQFPADIWGIIFSQLDIWSMISLALTCHRLHALFGTMSTNVLFGDTWQICHRGSMEIPIDRISPLLNRSCQELITYTGPVPEEFRQQFESMRGSANGRTRLLHLTISTDMTWRNLPETNIIDYHIVIDECRYHVFRLLIDNPQMTCECRSVMWGSFRSQMTYTQFHRNGNVMIRTSYQRSTITDCQILNARGRCVFRMYLDHTDWSYYRERPGRKMRSSYKEPISAYIIALPNLLFPPNIPQVFRPDQPQRNGITLSEIMRRIKIHAIKAIYLTPPQLV